MSETELKALSERLFDIEFRVAKVESKLSQAFEWLEEEEDEKNSRK